MSFILVRTRKNRRYLYRETRWREGRRVRSRSDYLGPLDSSAAGARPFDEAQDRAMAVAEREAAKVDAYQRAMFGETGLEKSQREQREHLDRLQDDYGLRIGPSNPVPVEPSREVVSPEPGKDQAAEEDAPDTEAQDNDPEGGEAPAL
jgi:hypothetical protein